MAFNSTFKRIGLFLQDRIAEKFTVFLMHQGASLQQEIQSQTQGRV